jgi:hypothetical protein
MNTLELLSKHDLHVKELDEYISADIPIDTHYIMKGSEVIAKLNIKSVDGWVRSLDSHVERIKTALISEGLDINDQDSCLNWISETVLKTRNSNVYKRFILNKTAP